MRTVLDEGTCQGQLQRFHIHRQQVAKIRVNEEADICVGRFDEPKPGLQDQQLPQQAPANEDEEAAVMESLHGQPATNGLDQVGHRDVQLQPPAQLPNGASNQQHDSSRAIDTNNHYDDHHQRHRVGHFQTPPSQLQAYKTNPVTLQTTPVAPKVYPNNTLVEDLTRCHQNLWPKAARATSKTLQLMRFCLPKKPDYDQDDLESTNQVDPIKPSNQNGVIVDLEQREQNHQNYNHLHQELRTAASVLVSHKVDSCDSAISEKPLATKQLVVKKLKDKKKYKTDKTSRPVPKTRITRDYKFPMPSSILRLNSTLTQDDYNRALCVLANDIRFQLHILLYRRLQTIWMLFSTVLCIVLPTLINVNIGTAVILGSCLLWLVLQAVGLPIGGRFRKKLDRMLERSVAQVNSYFMDHKLMLGVINVGGLFKRSRLVVPVVYFDTFQCIEQIESIVSSDLKSIEADRNNDNKHQIKHQQQQVALDYTKIGFSKMEPNQRAFAKSQLAKKIVLRFSQRWISQFDRSKLMFTDDQTKPRHLSTGKCLCQFIEEHFRCEQIKDLDEPIEGCCGGLSPAATTNDTLERVQELATTPAKIKDNSKPHQQQQQRLNRNKSQAQIKQQMLKRQETEASITMALTRNESYNDEDDCVDSGETIIDMPTQNGLNGNKSHDLRRQELPPPPPASIRALNLTLQSNNETINGEGRFDQQHSRSCDNLVPTLSHLVSNMKGRGQHDLIKVNYSVYLDSNNTNSQQPGKLIDGIASHLQHERIDSRSSQATELSLELDCESLMNRNDELASKLKLLLKFRSNEFSKSLDSGGIGASSTTSTTSTATATKSGRATTTTSTTTINLTNNNCSSIKSGMTMICDNQHPKQSTLKFEAASQLNGHQTTIHRDDANNNNNNNHGSSPMNQISKKFFAQADGLFFMGSKKGRQQGVYVKPQQRMLEIC